MIELDQNLTLGQAYELYDKLKIKSEHVITKWYNFVRISKEEDQHSSPFLTNYIIKIKI